MLKGRLGWALNDPKNGARKQFNCPKHGYTIWILYGYYMDIIWILYGLYGIPEDGQFTGRNGKTMINQRTLRFQTLRQSHILH